MIQSTLYTTRLSFQLGKPLDLGLYFGPHRPLGIGLSVAVREGRGRGVLFFSLREAYVLSFSLLLCLEPCKKFSVVVGGWWWWSTVNLVFCFVPKLWFWTWTKLNNIGNHHSQATNMPKNFSQVIKFHFTKGVNNLQPSSFYNFRVSATFSLSVCLGHNFNNGTSIHIHILFSQQICISVNF